MAFNCLKSFSIFNDASFVRMPIATPHTDLERKDYRYIASKIFQTYRDQTLHYKKNYLTENQYGMQPSNLPDKAQSYDWVILAQRDHLAIAQCKGLRNIPSRAVECEILRKIHYQPIFRDGVGLSKLVFAMCRQINDSLELFGTDSTGNMLRLQCDAS